MTAIYSGMISVIEFINTYITGGYYPVAIILFTLLIKLVLMPLDIKSRSTMRRTQKLQPKINAINEKYKNDPEKRNQKTMELYKAEKASPTGGCLPILIQMPILFAMWGMLRVIANEQLMNMFLAVESGIDYKNPQLIMQSFLWVHNFWQPDNFFGDSGSVIPMLNTATTQMQVSAASDLLTQVNVDHFKASYEAIMTPVIDYYGTQYLNGWGVLPILVAGIQFVQQKLQPQQAQPAPSADGKPGAGQMMKTFTMIMPIMFFFFCWGYLAAFSVYLLTSTLFSMAENFALNYYFKKKDEQAELMATTK